MERRIDLPGCDNFRDLGGYPARAGMRLRWRRLFRSDALHGLTPEGADRVVDELGIGAIVDLRSTGEVRIDGRGPLRERSPVYHHLPLFDGPLIVDPESVEPITLADRYFLMVEHAKVPIARVVTALAECSTPAVYHCAAGKDRTGLISASTRSAFSAWTTTCRRISAKPCAVPTRRALITRPTPRESWAFAPTSFWRMRATLWRRRGARRGWPGRRSWYNANTRPVPNNWLRYQAQEPVVTTFQFSQLSRGAVVAPHSDAPRKLFTMLLYFREPEWQDDWGGATAWAATDRIPFEEFKSIGSTGFVANRLAGFVRAEKSFHGVPPLSCPDALARKAFMINVKRLKWSKRNQI